MSTMTKCLVLLMFGSALFLQQISADGGGHSKTYRKQDDHGNYAFGYHIKDGKGASNFRKEHGNGWAQTGAYGLHDVDGRVRVVEYVADKGGFRAHIKTNEPGTGHLDAAAAVYNGHDEHGHSHTHVVSGSHGGHHGGDHGHGHGHHGGHHDHHSIDHGHHGHHGHHWGHH